jgi:deoxyadenosine/deoxycytidine kinase
MSSSQLIVGVVGPCASGKSTLVEQLRDLGYQGKHIAQEHSYVKDMWAKIAQPDVLIYLDVSYETTCQRTASTFSRKIYTNQVERLAHAKQNADLYVKTDHLSPAAVAEEVIRFLDNYPAG